MEKINYGNATYSLAEIDIRSYIELLKNIDETLAEPIEAMNLTDNSKNPNQEMCECLKKISLRKFCEVKKYLNLMKKQLELTLKIYLNFYVLVFLSQILLP